ncbi:MAG TPA: biotin/lipoyl-binding protein [Bacteroidales bacterium]|jgi:biotin carboxyl carrier protein|nr:biotin/lipoyl-binding protein [Bacteroidales bacterium]NLH32762.1 biotin/lipoyl-binding protein [Lentimicrobium sp.]HOF81623.1 biotin/lipoyl-binding protein [Bacteroidales bacterium]HPL12334.1 biotin/lipoyl-binding protein [Bacteroidales bacterium]
MKKFKFSIEGHDYDIEIMDFEDQIAKVEVNGTVYSVKLHQEIKQSKTPKLVRKEVEIKRQDHKIKKTIVKTEGFEVKSPLPGDILQIFVKEGDVVKLGDKLLVYEAMKMQNTILAERDGIIKNLKVQQGDTVLQDETLMEIEAKVTA